MTLSKTDTCMKSGDNFFPRINTTGHNTKCIYFKHDGVFLKNMIPCVYNLKLYTYIFISKHIQARKVSSQKFKKKNVCHQVPIPGYEY